MKFIQTTSLVIVSLLLTATSYAGPAVQGTITEIFAGEMDPFVIGDACVVFVAAEDQNYGLVMDDSCFDTMDDPESLVGRTVDIAGRDTDYIRDADAIRILQGFESGVFYVSFAGPLVTESDDGEDLTCNGVSTLRQAKACFTSYANANYSEGELPNSIVVSDEEHAVRSLAKIALTSTNFRRHMQILATADFVAVVNQHYDEDLYTYYAFNRGNEVEFKKIITINIVDLYYDWPAGVEPIEFALNERDVTDWHYEMFEEAREEAAFHERD